MDRSAGNITVTFDDVAFDISSAAGHDSQVNASKFEFGVVDGEIILIDEIHTPDSSRFWYEHSYEARFAAGQDPESFDKEYVRRFLAGQGFRGDGPIPEIPDEVKIEAMRRYIEAVERITGVTFVPNVEEPAERMRRNLRAAGFSL